MLFNTYVVTSFIFTFVIMSDDPVCTLNIERLGVLSSNWTHTRQSTPYGAWVPKHNELK